MPPYPVKCQSQEVKLQVNNIVGTNIIRMKKAFAVCIQDIHGEHSPIEVPFAYARHCIPATHYDIATPDKIHYQPEVEIGMVAF